MSFDAATPPRLDEGPTAEQRRRNLVLGSLLLALVLVLMGTWMIVFSRNGFPKDPQEAKRLQAQSQAAQASDAEAAPQSAAKNPEPAVERPAR